MYKEGGGPLLGAMQFGDSKYTHKTSVFDIKSHHVTWSLWETKDTENQHSDSVIPCIYHFIGNQDKNGPVCLVIKQQILKFTA